MAMVDVDSSSIQANSELKSIGCLACSESQRPLVAVLHSSDRADKLSQWLCHDDRHCPGIIIIIILVP